MKHPQLPVEKRTVLGKKIKKLRKQGILPGNVYGKGLQSTAVQLPTKEFEAVYKEVGETGLIDVQLDGQRRPVLIKNVHVDSVTKEILHTDFYQVNLKEKIKNMVPIELVGEAKAVTEKIGILLETLSEIEVEALPEELPEKIEVNVENLAQIDDQITVGDLKIPAGVEVLTDPAQVIVKVAELVSKEAEADAAAAEAAAAEAAAEGDGGEAPAEGEAKPEGEAEASTGEEKSEEKKE